MKNIFIYRIRILIAAAAMVGVYLNSHCVAPSGGGSEAGNARITGCVVDTEGFPIGNAQVTVRFAGFDPVKNTEESNTGIDQTGSDGIYRISVPKSQTYTIEAFLPIRGTRALIAEVKALEDDNTAPQCTLKVSGAIKVMVSDSANRALGYVFIPGTSLFAFLKSPFDTIVLDSVPAGTIPKITYLAINNTESIDIRYNIPVVSGDTTVVGNLPWKYARRIVLNTSSTGAGVTGDIYNFPVLIRLNSVNFDFTQARPDGGDLMFTTSRDLSLPFEIERWDATAKHAENWVKIDTVFGNDSIQSITMYWGNSDASHQSAGNGVFDTANDFQGVWHLSDADDDTFFDATVNQYNGVSPDTARPSISEGVIGNCSVFDGNEDFITMPNTASGKLDFPQNGNFSVSAWVMADTIIDLQQTLVSKGKYQYFLWIDSTSWQFWEFQDRAGWEASVQKATIRQWILLTGVRDGAIQRLYVNGEPTDSISLKSDITPRNTTSDLIFGRSHEYTAISNMDAGFCFFRGKIDEVRIISSAQSPEWVRLCYMNQRVDDRLVIFR